MSVRRSIDITALKARFREAATARGIDPVAGATGYQVVHLLTERQRVSADPGWWQNHELWDREDDPILHNPIEEAALMHLFMTTWLEHIAAVGVAAQAAHADDDIPPLRERLAERGEQLVWVDNGEGSTTPQITFAV